MSSIRWIAVLALLFVLPADGIAKSDGDKSGTPRTSYRGTINANQESFYPLNQDGSTTCTEWPLGGVRALCGLTTRWRQCNVLHLTENKCEAGFKISSSEDHA